MSDVSVIILTLNEELHLERCIRSVSKFTSNIYVVDSFSSDSTVEIARSLGAKVFQNQFTNHAVQFNWAISNCSICTEWIMKLDADEYVTEELSEEIKSRLCLVEQDISGFYIKRRLIFMERWIKHGGYYPTWLLRIWRRSSGVVENRWMDEHIKLTCGVCSSLDNDIVDHNLNSLSWWIEKHNRYSNREVVDILINAKFKSIGDSLNSSLWGSQVERKRWFKNIYLSLPLFVRPFLYFIWRYLFKLGFLDGRPGLIWHFLQGFWYRFVVDAKLYKLKKYSKNEGNDFRRGVASELGVELEKDV